MVETTFILNLINTCLHFGAIIVFSIIIVLFVKSRDNRVDITLILTVNTAVAGLLTCSTTVIMNFSNFFSAFLTWNMNFCHFWGLFYDISLCEMYHSYYLHASYRLIRVVFFRKKNLLALDLYMKLIGVQWLLIVILLLPPLVLDSYQILPNENFCLVPYTNLSAELYHIGLLYVIPICFTFTAYLWVTVFIRNSSRIAIRSLTTANLYRRNQRDLTMAKRVTLMLLFLVVLRFPTIILTTYSFISGYLHVSTYPLVGLIASLCLLFTGLMTIQMTPKLNHFFIRQNRIQVVN